MEKRGKDNVERPCGCACKTVLVLNLVVPYESVGATKGAKTACFFTWLATREVMLTAKNLRRQKAVRIFPEQGGRWGLDHILIHCRLDMRLLWDIFKWFGVSWAMPKSMKELMFNGKCGARGRRRKTCIVDHLEREKYESFWGRGPIPYFLLADPCISSLYRGLSVLVENHILQVSPPFFNDKGNPQPLSFGWA